MPKEAGQGRRTDWRVRLTTLLLGTASGIATNAVTGDQAGRVIAGLVILAALLNVSTQLRRYEGALIWRLGTHVMLALGLFAVVAVVVTSRAASPYFIFGAVGLTAAAALAVTEPEARLRIFSGTAIVSVGVATVAAGVIRVVDHSRSHGIAVIAVGMGAICVGITMVAERCSRQPRSIRSGVNVASLSFATALWESPNKALGLALACAATGLVIAELGLDELDRWWFGMSVTGVGLFLLATDLEAVMSGQHLLFMLAIATPGAATVVIGMSIMHDHPLLSAGAVASMGMAIASVGITVFAKHAPVLGEAGIGLGTVVAGYGGYRSFELERTRLLGWFTFLTRIPESQPPLDRGGEYRAGPRSSA